MIARNVESRIVKLEARSARPDEILVIWREPDGDVTAAAAGAPFSAGDKVICAEWFGEMPAPSPRWYRRPRSDMERSEYEYVIRSLRRVKDNCGRAGFAAVPHVASHRLVELTGNELLHIALGVET